MGWEGLLTHTSQLSYTYHIFCHTCPYLIPKGRIPNKIKLREIFNMKKNISNDRNVGIWGFFWEVWGSPAAGGGAFSPRRSRGAGASPAPWG